MKVINKPSSDYSYEEGLNMYIDDDGHFLSEDMLPENMQKELRMERMADYESEAERSIAEAENKYYNKIRDAYLAGDKKGILEYADYCLDNECEYKACDDKKVRKEFIEVIEKAAKLGHIRSIENLTLAYYHGDEDYFRPNFNKFLYWAKRGEKSNDPEFLSSLGDIYLVVYNNRDEDKYAQKALDVYIKAAESGSVEAMLNIYRIEKEIRDGFLREPYEIRGSKNNSHYFSDIAFHYLSKAAQTGDYEAMNLLGIELLTGHICNKDEKAAFGYFEQIINNFYAEDEYQRKKDIDYISKIRAFEEVKIESKMAGFGTSKYIPAFYNLGYCYEKGIGCEVDKERAFDLYCLASKFSGCGKVKLAYCFENGIGVAKNLEEALKIYKPLANAFISYDVSYLEDTLE